MSVVGEWIPRKPAPSPEWEKEYKRLTSNDPWLMEKVNRSRRLGEQWHYLRTLTPELWSMPQGHVIDLGCGPGELLEVARYAGHQILGVDALSGAGGMGDEYLTLSKLLRERQEVPQYPGDFQHWVKNWNGPESVLINSRGSWEQMFSAFQAGEPHHLHHDAQKLEWIIDNNLRTATAEAFLTIQKSLRNDGALLLHCNGSANHDQYLEQVLEPTAFAVGFRPVPTKFRMAYKWVFSQ